MINFGSPRTGDKNFATFSDNLFQQQWRVVYHKDYVPHTPESTLNYYHVRTEVYEDVDGSLRICDASGEDPTCAN